MWPREHAPAAIPAKIGRVLHHGVPLRSRSDSGHLHVARRSVGAQGRTPRRNVWPLVLTTRVSAVRPTRRLASCKQPVAASPWPACRLLTNATRTGVEERLRQAHYSRQPFRSTSCRMHHNEAAADREFACQAADPLDDQQHWRFVVVFGGLRFWGCVFGVAFLE